MDLTKKAEKKYWATLPQYNSDPQFIEESQKEFISSPLVEESSGLDRRDFMKLMAASTAMATAACYQKPMHKILPYVNQPEEVTFGVPNYYASTCTECAAGCGTLIKTREGRPIKMEGNPDHPMNKGALCARGQASILGLYDPDRLRSPVKISGRGSSVTHKMSWEEMDKEVSLKLKNAKCVRILSETINSPSTLKITKEFLAAFDDGQHVMFDAIGSEAVIEGQEASFGQKVLPRFNFSKADVVVSIDADFLGTWISPVEFTKQFSSTRKLSNKKKTLSKLFTFESMMTLTGTNADERFAIRPQDSIRIALALAHELGDTNDALKDYSAEKVASLTGVPAEKIKEVAKALSKSRGKSLVVAGSPQATTESAVGLQVVVNMINSMLGNDGITVDYSNSPSLQSMSNSKAMSVLIKEMSEGKVDALIIYKANPSYSLPESSGFTTALKKVKNIIYVGQEINETAIHTDYVMADNHGLESWGDSEPQKGLFSLIQPTIRPLYDTRSYQDSLIALVKAGAANSSKLKAVEDWHEYLQKNWQDSIYKNYGVKSGFTAFWESTLRDGVFDSVKAGRERASTSRTFRASLKQYLPKESKVDAMQAVFYPQVAMYDGSNANNPWLQELPDPISKMTWDNYASVSPATAKRLKLFDGDFVKIKFNDSTLEVPAHIQPGLHTDVIAVALGYGRTHTGKIGTDLGINAFKFAKFGSHGMQFSGMTADVSKTGEKYLLSTPQQHQSLEGRPIVKEASFKEWLENPNAGNEEHEHLTTVWPEHKYEGYRWAMAIDMNSCTGCNACVVSCQSENNIPVVGKDGVNRGRIMHWIRIDRYYTGTPDNPQVVHQPMLCQHCENAPCETVCPVIATAHSDEGLNQQIYNRCVGTRYCANNCPYKVRRFNWFEYNYGGQTKHPMNLAQNPEVTVRSRGIMEKCTFCIQRITEGKNNAKNFGRPVKDGEIKTACQQSCPADAITFGNINDPTSEIAQIVKDPRGFHVLEELNVRPSITYLTKIRNLENG